MDKFSGKIVMNFVMHKSFMNAYFKDFIKKQEKYGKSGQF